MEWSTQAKPELLPGATGLRAGDAPLARSTPEANASAHSAMTACGPTGRPKPESGNLRADPARAAALSHLKKGSTAASPMAAKPIGKNFLRTIWAAVDRHGPPLPDLAQAADSHGLDATERPHDPDAQGHANRIAAYRILP